jgi:hypothetical protein
MKKACEYEAHAQECRTLAARSPPGEQRDHFLRLAAMWERQAHAREDWIRRHPERDQSLGHRKDKA